MRKIISQWAVGKYVVLETDQGLPMKPYKKYRINGEEYDSVPVYDLPRSIAIEAKGDFVGKTVEFI